MDKDFKARMRRLYHRLNSAMLAGVIEKQSYDLGVQILSIMLQRRSDAGITFTWHDLVQSHIVAKDKVIASPVSDLHFYLYGGLQQLQEKLGIITNVDRAELLCDVVAAQEGNTPAHITEMPDTPSLVIMARTPIHCTYVEEQQDRLQSFFSSKCEEGVHVLPSWVGSGRV